MSRHSSSAHPLIVVLFCSFWGGDALAQGAGNAAAAETLFEEGRRLMSSGNYAEACPKLAASQKLDPGAGTLLNLAACYEKNGQTASAWATYKEAASESKKTGHADWEDLARSRATALEPSLSRLLIIVPPQNRVPGLVVERDGVVVDPAEWGSAIPVDPGLHPVSATAPKKQVWQTTVTIGPNASRAEVTIPLLGLEQGIPVPSAAPSASVASPSVSASAAPAAVPSALPSETSSSQSTIGLVFGAAGLVSLAVGGYFGLKAMSTHDDSLSYCSPERKCSREGLDLDETARRQASISTGATVCGALLLSAGAILYFTTPKPSSVHVGLAPNPSGASLALGGNF